MTLVIVDNRANEQETPQEIIKLCSIVAVFASPNYVPNTKYLNMPQTELNEFEKQVKIKDSVYSLLKTQDDEFEAK